MSLIICIHRVGGKEICDFLLNSGRVHILTVVSALKLCKQTAYHGCLVKAKDHGKPYENSKQEPAKYISTALNTIRKGRPSALTNR